MTEQDSKIIEAMETYGGSFVQALAVAYSRADDINRAKIRQTWPELWIKYADFAGVDL